MLKKIILVVFILIVLGTTAFTGWASQTNPILPAAVAALQSDSRVQVSAGDWIVFTPVGGKPETGFIFYPGGKVDYRAYAPYARAVASQGFLVIIPRMPLNLAVFDPASAARVIAAYPEIRFWAVGGHSLGGSMAANFAAKNPGQVRGLVLLASYPAGSDDLSQSGIRALSLYGTNDGLATGAKIDAARGLLPAGTRYEPVTGGNHAQFGDYGVQSGDGPATVTREDQQKQAIQTTVDLLRSLSDQ